MTDQSKEVAILLVEDNDIDAEGIERAFRKQRIANPVVRARDGLDALEMLEGANAANSIERPFLILLDINMPRMDGIEFLQNLRKNETLRDSIVFVLTTSDDDRDKVLAYDQNIAGYILKSNVGTDFVNLVTMLEHFWRYVEFPTR